MKIRQHIAICSRNAHAAVKSRVYTVLYVWQASERKQLEHLVVHEFCRAVERILRPYIEREIQTQKQRNK